MPIHRRDMLRLTSAATLSLALPSTGETATPTRVVTVTGDIDARTMGVTLTHEHALANFQSYDDWAKAPAPYDRAEVVTAALPHLIRIRDLGCKTFIDATGAFLGRDPQVLHSLSLRSGLNIVMATGNYAADKNRHLPPWVFTEESEDLAARWIDEFRNGIDGTGVRPGFIKLSFDGGPLSVVERKMVRAAAIAHLATGLTIGVHTGAPGAAESTLEQLFILKEMKVHPSAWIWIHAQNETDLTRQVAAARLGAWVEFDGVRTETLTAHLDLVRRMRDEGLLDQVLVSQDSGWYHIGTPGGGEFNGYDLIFTQFIPALRESGFTEAEINRIFVANPAHAFALKKRPM